MKKTYVKVTALICALILVVMVLGCALFTYFQVDRINSQYIEDIYKAAKSSRIPLPLSRMPTISL